MVSITVTKMDEGRIRIWNSHSGMCAISKEAALQLAKDLLMACGEPEDFCGLRKSDLPPDLNETASEANARSNRSPAEIQRRANNIFNAYKDRTTVESHEYDIYILADLVANLATRVKEQEGPYHKCSNCGYEDRI